MKMYVCSNKNISVMDNGVKKIFQPIILSDENSSHLFENSNYVLIDTLFDINELREISRQVNSNLLETKKLMEEKTLELEQLKSEISSFCQYGESIKNEIKDISELSNKFNKILLDMDAKQSSLLSILNEYEEKINLDKKEYEKSVAGSLEKLSCSLSEARFLEDEAEEKIVNKFNLIKQELDRIYKDFSEESQRIIVEMKELAEKSRKWASNPVNIPVEDGKYSARHYALILKGEK